MELKHKKLTVGVASAVLILANDAMGKPISDEAIMKAIGMLGVYILGQGFADMGKEKAKVESSAMWEALDDGPDWEDTSEMDAADKE